METSGMGFTTIIQVALNQYFDQREALDAMNNLSPLIQKLEELQKLEVKK